ncbi:MAG TPA: hypothetical protein PLJ60_02885 [Chryseolinea sp.]|nr:hypothetical protein [Chryseolinea sp.]
MKRLRIVVILLVITAHKALALNLPIETQILLQDTVIQSDTLYITPYLSKTSAKGIGNYAVVPNDKIALQTNAGFNVMNTLRGHIPNFSIGANTSPSTTGLRSGGSLMVIDGLPYNSGFSNYYNLNSFEYENVYAISSGNGMALYGGAGNNGAFFLQGKTGKGFKRPTFELNSSSSLTSSELSSFAGENQTSNQVVLTNAIAYKQDFGVVDTRVSYSYSYLPDGSAPSDNQTNYHNLRINTGFSIAPHFTARLILDDLYTKNRSSQNITFNSVSFLSGTEMIRKNLQGNLQLKYQPLKWLSFTSQSSLGQIENNIESVLQTASSTDQKQKRQFANLFASVNKSIITDLSLTAFAGFQYEKVKTEQQFKSSSSYGESYSEYKTNSLLGGVGAQFKDYLFLDFNYRQDYFSVFASDNNSTPTYSLNSSFIFSEAFSWNNSWFSFGKVRSSIGKSSVGIYQGYPNGNFNSTLTLNSYPNPDLHASTKQMVEIGSDLSFVQNRITLNASYFTNHHDEMATRLPVPSSSNGFIYVTSNSLTMNTKGWEIVLGATLFKKSNFTMDTKLTWSTYKSETKIATNPDAANTGIPITTGGVTVIYYTQPFGNLTPTPGLSLGSPYPDWTSSILNQITFKNFFTSFLFDFRQGGTFYSLDYSTTFPTYSSQDGTMARLRDLSLGYRLASSILDKVLIREAQISISGRNLWTPYSKSDTDVENSFNNPVQKSGTLSLTLMF